MFFLSWARIPSSRSKGGNPHQLYLLHVERGNPNEVSTEVDMLSTLTAKKAELLSGTGRIKKRIAASRKGTERDNWADRANDGDTRAERRLT